MCEHTIYEGGEVTFLVQEDPNAASTLSPTIKAEDSDALAMQLSNVAISQCPPRKKAKHSHATQEQATPRTQSRPRRNSHRHRHPHPQTKDNHHHNPKHKQPTPTPTPPPTIHKIHTSKAHLASASPYFARMLTSPHWTEGRTLNQTCHLTLTVDWPLTPFLLLMRILHHQTHPWPEKVDLPTLVDVTIIADYYGCVHVVKFHVSPWLHQLELRLPRWYTEEVVMQWIFVAWVYGREDALRCCTRMAIENATDEVRADVYGLPVCGKIIESINHWRCRAIFRVRRALKHMRREFLMDLRGEGFDTNATWLGALEINCHRGRIRLREEFEGEDEGEKEEPYVGESYRGLVKKIDGWRNPEGYDLKAALDLPIVIQGVTWKVIREYPYARVE
ncbi:hypothetical protein ASPACDRAFT_45541 [Aspergillus aculeatus ATCC 16872]|uniref:BTB domain-containing protein n=1 Tax=Aspergillus aculeatus (strain ATCC 16872 / CBS 172.66 / WB 5094) TaxID=690307 RepID=A0A1L9WMR6_ASPA1|nr:uncharacterized protein ASPACDRAFT_45541 [Aspergillus aculeatus ATCC 16872]OJJ97451.1 hypothetical protein ASPACDRAFT_45541 [Aspergillus aculeatus ATCC 16872]